MPERRLAVFGPGLLGASVALAARSSQAVSAVAIWGRREEAVSQAAGLNIAEACTTNLEEAVTGASLIILATPIETMSDLATRISSCEVSKDLVVTDVGSVKSCVVDGAGAIFKEADIDFVGSHPMAGGEKQGMEQARADLFRGAACILTTDGVSSSGLQRVESFWSQIGARTSTMNAADHDRVVAKISHLPHVVASALVRASLGESPDSLEFAGGGFRDTTRVASGDPDLWAGIIKANRAALLEPLHNMQREVGELLAMLEEFDEEKLRDFLQSAKLLRDQFRQ